MTQLETEEAALPLQAESNGDAPQPQVTNGEARQSQVDDPEAKPLDDSESTKTFTFRPADGGDPITVTSVSVAIPDGPKQRWFFWKLRKLEGLEQPIFWLEQAGVPEHVQERIMLLPDDEWSRFYQEWMAGGAGVTPGE